MAKSYYDVVRDEDQYILNNFNFYKFDDENILVTVEHGAWVLLSKHEFDLLRWGRAHEDPTLFKELHDKGIVLTESNIEKVVKAYRDRFAFLFNGPSLHIIDPTLRCNQRCVYCHSRAQPEKVKEYDMDKETAKKAVEFMLQAPAKSIVIELQGGECLLNYEVTEFIIDYATELAKKKGKRVNFALVTNLTSMNEEIINSLKTRKIIGLATSLDGPKEVHDRNRRYLSGTGTYEDVVYWIRRIKEEWKYMFNLNGLCTITRYSLDHGKEIVDEYIKLGFDSVWLRPLNNIGFAADAWSKIGYTPEEYLAFYKDTLDYMLQPAIGDKIRELYAVIFLDKIITRYDPMMIDIMMPCGAAIGQLLYAYNGDIYTCDESKLFNEFKLGNVHTHTYKDVFKNRTVAAMIDISSKKNYLCDHCPWNPYCGICPVYTYAAQGTVVSKLAMDAKCKMHKELIKLVFKKLLFSEKEKQILMKWFRRDTVFAKNVRARKASMRQIK
jgi:His-Xaa-Ser system radical SAM maturase HxsB